MQPVFHLTAPYIGKPSIPESRRKMLAGNTLVHLPAQLADFDVRQIDGCDKGVEVDGIGLCMSSASFDRRG